MDAQGFFDVDVLVLHEPARRIGADGDEGDVEAAALVGLLPLGQALADADEVARVAGVAGVEQLAVRREHRKAAPQVCMVRQARRTNGGRAAA